MHVSGIKSPNLMVGDLVGDSHFKITHEYRISSNKRSCFLLHVETLKGSAYQRATLKKARCLFQKKVYSHEI